LKIFEYFSYLKEKLKQQRQKRQQLQKPLQLLQILMRLVANLMGQKKEIVVVLKAKLLIKKIVQVIKARF
jgi:hypothetical protein